MNLLISLVMVWSFVGDRAVRGLAMAVNEPQDLITLRVEWFYNWSFSGEDIGEAEFIPMAYSMQIPPSCPDYLMVGNEPNATSPFGYPISPWDAVLKTIDIEKACPKTRLVSANISVDDWSPSGGWGRGDNWLVQFLQEYKSLTGKNYSQIIGVHCYTQHRADYCIWSLEWIRELYAGEMWVTEFGVLSGNEYQFKSLLSYVSGGRFARYAAYTNRQPRTNQGWEISRNVELVNNDDSLTPTGSIFASWGIGEYKLVTYQDIINAYYFKYGDKMWHKWLEHNIGSIPSRDSVFTDYGKLPVEIKQSLGIK